MTANGNSAGMVYVVFTLEEGLPGDCKAYFNRGRAEKERESLIVAEYGSEQEYEERLRDGDAPNVHLLLDVPVVNG